MFVVFLILVILYFLPCAALLLMAYLDGSFYKFGFWASTIPAFIPGLNATIFWGDLLGWK